MVVGFTVMQKSALLIVRKVMSNSRELTAPGMCVNLAFPLRELLAPGYFLRQ
jgi:hypothetical protein